MEQQKAAASGEQVSKSECDITKSPSDTHISSKMSAHTADKESIGKGRPDTSHDEAAATEYYSRADNL